jgi:hypothetical protein
MGGVPTLKICKTGKRLCSDIEIGVEQLTPAG